MKKHHSMMVDSIIARLQSEKFIRYLTSLRRQWTRQQWEAFKRKTTENILRPPPTPLGIRVSSKWKEATQAKLKAWEDAFARIEQLN